MVGIINGSSVLIVTGPSFFRIRIVIADPSSAFHQDDNDTVVDYTRFAPMEALCVATIN